MKKKRRYPNVTSFKDRHGKVRWRYRKTGQTTYYFSHHPDTPGFKEELAACEVGATHAYLGPNTSRAAG